jgi:hypothetical protein
MTKKLNLTILCFLITVFLTSFVSAGVGIKWGQESVLVNENQETCLSYSVYNPWPDDTKVTIELSNELSEVLTLQSADTKLIPSNTASNQAIPVRFCFKSPKVYQEDCILGDSLLCQQKCSQEQVVYEGEVIVKSLPTPQAGGSSTSSSVSAPMKIKIRCNPYSRDLTLIYTLIAAISFIVIVVVLYKKYRK